MKTLAYLVGFYAATCVGSLAGFAALVVQAARRDRAQGGEIPSQRPAPELTRPEQVRRMAAIRVACVGWSDLEDWQNELDYDRNRTEYDQ